MATVPNGSRSCVFAGQLSRFPKPEASLNFNYVSHATSFGGCDLGQPLRQLSFGLLQHLVGDGIGGC